MQVSRTIHALKIPFRIPLAPDISLDRSVYLYLVLGPRITVIDSGVAGAHQVVFDYLQAHGRNPEEITTLILTHSHPDHVGGARSLHNRTGCRILAHAREKAWIEDTARQQQERPVPGFDQLVEGSVPVDALLEDGRNVDLDGTTSCRVHATPGHSPGSLSLLFPEEKVLVTGDALPLPGDLPIYDDFALSLQSIGKLRELSGQAETLLSSWEPPLHGNAQIRQRIAEGVSWLRRVHSRVLRIHEEENSAGMELCARVVSELGLPPSAANPLVARSLRANLAAAETADLFAPWDEP